MRRSAFVSTFVSVGNSSQPFPRLLEKVAELAPHLPQPVTVQCGKSPFMSSTCAVRPLLGMDEFAQSVADAKLVVLHAGAGSIIHAARAGKIPVVMPRRARYGEHVDDHQVDLALELEKSGKVIVALEPEDLDAAITRALARTPVPAGDEQGSVMVALVRECLEAYASGRR
jgi:UDP-N-acetylglucosamine transferase subunit ALG13